MKRDMDLCREILRQIEESPDSASPAIRIEGRSAEEISYHVKLLSEAGLVEAGAADGRFISKEADGSDRIKGQKVYSPNSLTWQGHDFLDAARDDTIWRKANSKILESGGGLAFDVLKAMLIAEAKRRLGLS
jgi:hypothetical protein